MKKSKPSCKVAIAYRVFRRNLRTRRLVPVGRELRAIEEALLQREAARRSWPDARLVRTTLLTEVLS